MQIAGGKTCWLKWSGGAAALKEAQEKERKFTSALSGGGGAQRRRHPAAVLFNTKSVMLILQKGLREVWDSWLPRAITCQLGVAVVLIRHVRSQSQDAFSSARNALAGNVSQMRRLDDFQVKNDALHIPADQQVMRLLNALHGWLLRGFRTCLCSSNRNVPSGSG